MDKPAPLLTLSRRFDQALHHLPRLSLPHVEGEREREQEVNAHAAATQSLRKRGSLLSRLVFHFGRYLVLVYACNDGWVGHGLGWSRATCRGRAATACPRRPSTRSYRRLWMVLCHGLRSYTKRFEDDEVRDR